MYCIIWMGILLRVALVRTNLPVMLRIFYFQPASLLDILSVISWKSTFIEALWKMGKPRCFPNSMLLSMPRALEHSKVFWLEVLRENKTLDLALLICCSEVLLELKKVEKIALQLFLLALAIRVRSGDFRAISCNRDRSPIFVGHLIVNVSEQSFHVNDEQVG